VATITIDAGSLGARITSDHKGAPKAVSRAIYSGLQRGKAYIVGKSPVDRGILRNAWKVIRLSNGGSELVNDQPYAGIMERGARPFKISREGREALARWVFRKILQGSIQVQKAGRVSKAKYLPVGVAQARAQQHKARVRAELEAEADAIAWAIAKKFERVGMKGKRFVWQALPKLADIMEEEINRSLTKFFNRPSGK
jgi:hypothetical protein